MRLFRNLTLESKCKGDGCHSWPAGARIHDIRGDHVDVDVLAHLLKDYLDGLAFAVLLVQTVFIHDFHQVTAGHDALADHLDTLRRVTGHRGLDQFGGDPLFLDQNGCSGLVGRRPHKGGNQAENEYHSGDQKDHAAATPEGGQIIAEFEGLFQSQFSHDGLVRY